MTATGVINPDVVTEVNGETGDVDLSAADVGADAAGAATAAVAAHVAALDPHGDRAYSDQELADGLATKLDLLNPVITNSTLTVRKGDDSSAARFRSTGGAVDMDYHGDLVESAWSGPAFTGVQTPTARRRGGGGMTFAGLTEFGSSVYAAEQAIDGTTGVARLGARNGATNLRFCGYLDIETAPVSGTWDTGDVVMTRAGYFRCTSGGTPGTWFWIGRFDERDAGYAAWMYQPGDAVQSGTIVPTGGLSYVFRFRAVASTISALQVHLTTSPSGITNAWASLHNDAGAVLGGGAKSSQRAADFTTGGLKTMPLDVQQGVTPGAYYRGRIWFTTSSTLPTMSRATNSASAIINPGQPTSGPASTPFRWASADGGLTDMASAPDQIGTLIGIATAWWMGVTP